MNQVLDQIKAEDENISTLPYLQTFKGQNETIYGYPQRHPPSINSLCSNQYFGLINIIDIKTNSLLASQCCILISPIHVITTKDSLSESLKVMRFQPEQIFIKFQQYETRVSSFVELDRFVVMTLHHNFGEILGYVGFLSKEYENQEDNSYEISNGTAYLQGLNEQGTISYFQAIAYRENTSELEAPNCGYNKLLKGCAMLKYDKEFGVILHGLVSFSDNKQRIVVQKISFKDILIINEVVLAAGIIMNERKIDITALYSLDQKTFLNSKSKIYRKSLYFDSSLQSLEKSKQQSQQFIEIKVINTQLICAISKIGDLFIINIETGDVEHRMQLQETPSLLQVIHDELFIGLNKQLLVINYVQGYSPVKTYAFDSQILSLLLIEESKSNTSINSTLYLVGCFNGLFMLDSQDNAPKKLEIPNTQFNKVLNLKFNQELNKNSPIHSYSIYTNPSQILLSSSEKIMILELQQQKIQKQYIGHTKNVYFLEQIRANLIVSGSSDNSLILWDKQSGSLLKQVQFSNPIYHGYLLNPSEVVVIDYNTVRIFNTITFQQTKYDYHQKPITCSSKISEHSFVTCDTSNQIILWKADTFIAQSFIESEFVKNIIFKKVFLMRINNKSLDFQFIV